MPNSLGLAVSEEITMWRFFAGIPAIIRRIPHAARATPASVERFSSEPQKKFQRLCGLLIRVRHHRVGIVVCSLGAGKPRRLA